MSDPFTSAIGALTNTMSVIWNGVETTKARERQKAIDKWTIFLDRRQMEQKAHALIFRLDVRRNIIRQLNLGVDPNALQLKQLQSMGPLKLSDPMPSYRTLHDPDREDYLVINDDGFYPAQGRFIMPSLDVVTEVPSPQSAAVGVGGGALAGFLLGGPLGALLGGAGGGMAAGLRAKDAGRTERVDVSTWISWNEEALRYLNKHLKRQDAADAKAAKDPKGWIGYLEWTGEVSQAEAMTMNRYYPDEAGTAVRNASDLVQASDEESRKALMVP